MEFSKMLLIVDYAFMVLLIIVALAKPDTSVIAIAWVGQVAVSSGFYFWKAKNENRIKIPIRLLRSLNRDGSELDLNQIIHDIIEKE